MGSDYAGQSNKQKIASPLPPFWCSGRKNQKQPSPKSSSKMYGSPMYDDREANLGSHDERHVLSFDVIVLMAQELNRVKEVPEEEQVVEVNHCPINGNAQDRAHVSEIMEEPGTSEAV